MLAAFRDIYKTYGKSAPRQQEAASGFNRNPARQLLPHILTRRNKPRPPNAPHDEELGSLSVSSSAQRITGPTTATLPPASGAPVDRDRGQSPSAPGAGGQQSLATDGGIQSRLSHAESNEPKEENQKESPSAPNISLNIHGPSHNSELYAAALCGILSQFGVLVFCAFSVYQPTFKKGFPKDRKPVPFYAFPLMATGTVVLAIGMVICSYIVEASTEEKVYSVPGTGSASSGSRPSDLKVRILWLQKSHVVSDQKFDSHVVFGPKESGPRDGAGILTSRRNTSTESPSSSQRSDPLNAKKPWLVWARKIASTRTEFFTILGVFFGLSGFVLQFQGLRGMNWSASIAQLVCILFMTIWRAWVRRGLIAIPISEQVLEDHEMDWLALRIAKSDQSGGGDFWPSEDQLHENECLNWEISICEENLAHAGFWDYDHSKVEESPPESKQAPQLEHPPQTRPESESQPGLSTELATSALNLRRRLGQLTNWTGQTSLISVSVASSIEIVMNTIFDKKEEDKSFVWTLGVTVDGKAAKIPLRVERSRSEQRWKVDATSIEAVLSLSVFDIRTTQTSEKGMIEKGANIDWLRGDLELKREVVQLLGPDEPSKTLRRDIKWWVGDLIYTNDTSIGQLDRGFSGPVGFVGTQSGQTQGSPYLADWCGL